MFRQTIIAAALTLAAQAASAGVAGTVVYVMGKAEIAGKAATLNAAVNEGELLSTGADGYIYIRTPDNGMLFLRPNSKARIDTYVIDRQNPANTRVKLELLQGVARSQSGEAVKHARQNFRFNTPVAAIGVRGTDFAVYTDDKTSRVTVYSGGITMSGFGGACAPEGGGPCEGAASRELNAAQRGLLLQVQRGQAAPQLMQSNTTTPSPDVVIPPRSDESQAAAPAVTTTTTTGTAKVTVAATPLAEVNLDPRKNVTLQEGAKQAVQPPVVTTPSEKPPPEIVVVQPVPEVPALPPASDPVVPTVPVVPVTPDPVTPPPPAPVDPVTQVPELPEPPAPPVVPPPPPPPLKEISWGRWNTLAGKPASTAFSKDDADRIALNDYFVLFRESTGSDYVVPEKGSIGLALASSEAYVRDNSTDQKTPVKLENAALLFDFDKAAFNTKFDVVYQTKAYNMYSSGVLGKDGVFSSLNMYDATSNMTVDGVLSQDKASYLFQGLIDPRRSVIGATNWIK